MADRHPDAPPALPTDAANRPASAADIAHDGVRRRALALLAGPSTAAPRLEEACRLRTAGDPCAATAHALAAVGSLLADLENGTKAAESFSDAGTLAGCVLRFLDDEAVVAESLPDAALLDRIATARFRLGFGPAESGGMGHASATAAVLSACEAVRDILACFPEAATLHDMARAAEPLLPSAARAGGDWRFDAQERLRPLGGSFASLAAAFRAFPAGRLGTALLSVFDDLRPSSLVAGMEQELTHVLSEARAAAGPAATESGVAPGPHPDGPEEPCWLWWGGTRHQIGDGRSVRSWQLLNAVWGRRSVPFRALMGTGRPWQAEVADATIASAVTRLNRELPSDLPRRTAVRGRCVVWQESPDIS